MHPLQQYIQSIPLDQRKSTMSDIDINSAEHKKSISRSVDEFKTACLAFSRAFVRVNAKATPSDKALLDEAVKVYQELWNPVYINALAEQVKALLGEDKNTVVRSKKAVAQFDSAAVDLAVSNCLISKK